jgi:hypothetical protein
MDDFALPCSLVLLKPVAPTEYPVANVLVCVVSAPDYHPTNCPFEIDGCKDRSDRGVLARKRTDAGMPSDLSI